MQSQSFNGLSGGLLRTVLLSITLPVVGCGSGDPLDQLDLSQFDSPSCTPRGWMSISGLNPAARVDYLELRERYFQISGSPASQTTVVDAQGTPCATASMRTTCESDLAKVDLTYANLHNEGHWFAGSSSYLVSTQGDSVQSVSEIPDLIRFLAPIDEPQEAILVVWGRGADVACSNKARGAVRPSEDGFDVLATQLGAGLTAAPKPITQQLLHVSSTGSVSVLLSRKIGESL